MKRTSWVILLVIISCIGKSQPVKNTSYISASGEKVLRLEIILPADLHASWDLFTKDDQLQKWIAPVAHIELRTGGYIITNYDKEKGLADSSSIHLPIINYLDQEMIVLKVNLNASFAQSARETDQQLQEIIQLKAIDQKHTKIISSMVGFGNGTDWDKTYQFFLKGNEWTYLEMLKLYPAK